MSRTRPSEYWSEELANSNGKPDANLANNALQLGGIEAEDYATKRYVQDYHNSKEELLKEYIDSQDLAKLQAAKDYVDTMIRNQDFSSFAKITDLQTLSENLSTRIEACKLQCQQELNTRLAAVVSDVNENFEDVNAAITTLNNATNDLFTSVSNGKEVVAAAITDKGQETASDATFTTMANNIRQIETGSLDTSDATAKAKDIVLGKTAYAKGVKLTGTLIPPTDYPTYGTDTSNANANAEDIALGKSVYVGGEYIVGTANPSVNPEVEEIYGTSVNDYSINDANIGLTTYPDTQEEVTARECIAFSKDGKYCVSVVNFNKFNDYTDKMIPASEYSNDYCIESHPVNENGLFIESSAGNNNETIYKKYRYTKEELGIDDEEVVSEIKFGAPGFLGYSTKCLLFIETYIRTGTGSNDYKYYLHLYTYHLNDNGVIGKEYNGARYDIQGYKEEIPYDYKIVCSNTDTSTFFLLRFYYHAWDDHWLYIKKCFVNYIADTQGNLKVNYFFGTDVRFNTSSCGLKCLNMTPDDKYIYSCSGGSSTIDLGFVITLDINLNPISCFFANNSYSVNGCGILSNTNQLICSRAQRNFSLYDNSNGNWILNKTISFNYPQDNTQNQWFQGNFIITPDNSRMIAITSERTGSGNADWRNNKTLRIAVFNVSDILNANDGDVIYPAQYSNLAFNGQDWTTTNNLFDIATNSDGTIIYIYSNSLTTGWSSFTENYFLRYNAQLWTLSVESNQQLLGIRYKNQFFRSSNSGLMSARTSDVASGKTFIGYDGTVQTGTLETSTEENSEETTT